MGEAEPEHFQLIRASKCHMRDWMKCFTYAGDLFPEKEPIKIVRKGEMFPKISLKCDWANLCLSRLKQANQISSFLLGNSTELAIGARSNTGHLSPLRAELMFH